MSGLLMAWRLLRPLLPYIAAVLAVLGLLSAYGHREYGRGKHSRDAEVSALNAKIDKMEDESAKAKARNAAHVETVETKQDQITKDSDDATATQLASVRAALAAYKLRHPAGQSYAGRDPLPQVPSAPGEPDAASTETIVPVADLDACATAYVVATGLQDWIKAEAAIDRGDGK